MSDAVTTPHPAAAAPPKEEMDGANPMFSPHLEKNGLAHSDDKIGLVITGHALKTAEENDVRLTMSVDDLRVLVSALREVGRVIDDCEFRLLIGRDKFGAYELGKKLHARLLDEGHDL